MLVHKVIVLILFVLPSIAMAGGGIGFQMVHEVSPDNIIQNGITASNSVSQLYNQAQQIQYQLQNMKNYNGNIGQWSQAQQLLQQLGQTVSQGQALSYSMQNVDEHFRQTFPGYQAPHNYQQSYQGWSESTMDTLSNTLNSAGLQAGEFANEQAEIDELKRLSQTSEGRMQAVQVGNMIATQQVGQLQKLRQLVMAQTNAQNTYMAYQVQKDQANNAALKKWIDNGDTKFPRYRDKGFGARDIPHPHR